MTERRKRVPILPPVKALPEKAKPKRAHGARRNAANNAARAALAEQALELRKQNLTERAIAERLGISPGHAHNLLAAALAKADERVTVAKRAFVFNALKELEELVTVGKRMLTAADAWLRDPDNREAYFLGPRTTEIVVDVTDRAGNRVPGPKRTLAELLEEAREPLKAVGRDVRLREARHADPRKLLLDAVATLKPVTELLGRELGQLKAAADDGAVMERQVALLRAVLREVVQSCERCRPIALERVRALRAAPDNGTAERETE